LFIEGDKKEYSITYILSSDVKRIIVFEDSSIDDKRIIFVSEFSEGYRDFNDSL
jgi:hypothetical protein